MESKKILLGPEVKIEGCGNTRPHEPHPFDGKFCRGYPGEVRDGRRRVRVSLVIMPVYNNGKTAGFYVIYRLKPLVTARNIAYHLRKIGYRARRGKWGVTVYDGVSTSSYDFNTAIEMFSREIEEHLTDTGCKALFLEIQGKGKR